MIKVTILAMTMEKIFGFKEGENSGIEKGLAKGKKILEESKIEIAKKLLLLNMDIDTISEITGLSKIEIQNLK